MDGDYLVVQIQFHLGTRIMYAQFLADELKRYTVVVLVLAQVHVSVFHDRHLLDGLQLIALFGQWFKGFLFKLPMILARVAFDPSALCNCAVPADFGCGH